MTHRDIKINIFFRRPSSLIFLPAAIGSRSFSTFH